MQSGVAGLRWSPALRDASTSSRQSGLANHNPRYFLSLDVSLLIDWRRRYFCALWHGSCISQASLQPTAVVNCKPGRKQMQYHHNWASRAIGTLFSDTMEHIEVRNMHFYTYTLIAAGSASPFAFDASGLCNVHYLQVASSFVIVVLEVFLSTIFTSSHTITALACIGGRGNPPRW